MSKAFKRGQIDHLAGISSSQNPFEVDTVDYMHWNQGWASAIFDPYVDDMEEVKPTYH